MPTAQGPREGFPSQLRAMEARSATPLPLRERLQTEKERLLDRVDNINKLLELLDNNPDFAEFHDLLTRSSY